MGKKLLLINPAQSKKPNLANLITIPSSSLGYLAALTPPGWDIKINDENIEDLTFEEADLVAITTYTCNAPRAYEVSEIYRRKGIKTVIGGVHVSMLPDEAAQYVDTVVTGEAESVWGTVLKDFEKNEMKKRYTSELISLDNQVHPRTDLYSWKYKLFTVETSRGCPNDCEFCTVGLFNGHKYRQRPVEDVLDELEKLPRKFFMFSDNNILGHGKKAEERAIRLFKGMVDRGIKKRWGCYVGIDFVNNPEVLKWAKKAGCSSCFIGFESLNEESLKEIQKTRNLKMGVDHYKEVVQKIHDNGIGLIIGSFVMGNDHDYLDIFQRTTDFILESKIDTAQLSILNPFPGTRLYKRLEKEGRLLCKNYPHDWQYLDFTKVLYKPKNMTPDQLREGVAQVYRDTSSRLISLKRAITSYKETKDLLGAIVAYFGNRSSGNLWRKVSGVFELEN